MIRISYSKLKVLVDVGQFPGRRIRQGRENTIDNGGEWKDHE
jgi:hypothetical protein